VHVPGKYADATTYAVELGECFKLSEEPEAFTAHSDERFNISLGINFGRD